MAAEILCVDSEMPPAGRVGSDRDFCKLQRVGSGRKFWVLIFWFIVSICSNASCQCEGGNGTVPPLSECVKKRRPHNWIMNDEL